MAEVTHSPGDTPGKVDPAQPVAVAGALRNLIMLLD
jgi:hypothetical protein